MIKNAKEGFWNGGGCPLGYEPVPDAANPKRKRLMPLEREAVIVREVFNLRLQGMGGRAIAMRLNERGSLNRGRKWNKTSVLHLLRNESVVGMTVLGKRNAQKKKISPDQVVRVQSHEPIIDQEVWDSVQTLLDAERPDSSRRGSEKSTWFFTGLVRCGKCGDAMQIESAKGRSKRYYYYNCRNYQRGGGCENRRLPAPDLEEWLTDIICQKLLSPRNLSGIVVDLAKMSKSWNADMTRRKAEVSAEISRLKQANDRLFSYLESPDQELQVSDLAPRIRSNNQQIEQLEKDLVALDMEAVPPEVDDIEVDELSDFLKRLVKESTDPRKVRMFFSDFIEDIRVEEDAVSINYFRELLVAGDVVPSKRKWYRRPDLNRHAIASIGF